LRIVQRVGGAMPGWEIFRGEQLVGFDPELRECERAVDRWESQAAAGVDPDWFMEAVVQDGEAREEIETLRDQYAELDKFRAEREPSVTGGQRSTPNPDWEFFAVHVLLELPEGIRTGAAIKALRARWREHWPKLPEERRLETRVPQLLKIVALLRQEKKPPSSTPARR
jgi:hypothetical protein